MDNKFDLLIIGGGPGGYAAAEHAARLGLRTAVAEEDQVGGACINRGCIPTKAMIYASSLYDAMKSCGRFGLSAGALGFDYGRLQQYQADSVLQFRGDIEERLAQAGVTLLRGRACILRPGAVAVTGPAGTDEYGADNILIATGAHPITPLIAGIDCPEVLTSTDILADPEWHYDALTIIGGGVVGVEFATVFNALGAKVTILEQRPRLLAPMDCEISQILEEHLRESGVTIHTGVEATAIERAEGGAVCRFVKDGREDSVFGNRILSASGRRANTEGLFAPELGLRTQGARIVVDREFRTNIPGVYAVGDVLEQVQLAHLASAQGIYVVDRLRGQAPTVMLSAVPSCSFVDLPIIPSCIYIEPEIASVGITEEKARELRIPVNCGRYSMRGNGKSIITKRDVGFIKLVFEARSKSLLGAQMMCPRATDMIGEMATAIANGLTSRQLMYAMRAHPTFNEGVSEAVRDSERESEPVELL